MSTLLLTDQNNPGCIISERSRARTRLSTHLRSRALDRALAAGVSPDASAALSLRAHSLIGATTRAGLARTIRRADREMPVSRRIRLRCLTCRAVAARSFSSAQTLEGLAERLVGDEPVDARGIAQVRLLLIGDRGALYDHPGCRRSRAGAAGAIQALELSV